MLLIFRYVDLNKGNFVHNYSSKFYLEEIFLLRKLYINNIFNKWYNYIYKCLKVVIILYSIMIIEDDKKMAKLIENHLERYGYKTFSIKDFSNIKDEVLECKPDLILMDINLPF